MSKSVVITGGTGFIGTQVVAELLRRGWQVHSLYFGNPAPKQENLFQYEMNLMDDKAVDAFLAEHKFENMIHLAWYTGPKCQISPLNLDWLSTSIRIVKSFVEHGGKIFLGAGSMSEYDFNCGWCREDETSLNSPSLYGKTKADFYETISKYSEYCGLKFKWCRMFNLYGPSEKPKRLMPAVINSMLNGENVEVSPCTQIQNYLHVQDAAKAIVDVFESDLIGAVNICSDTPLRLKDIVEKIKLFVGYTKAVQYGALKASFPQQFLSGDNSKLKSIGWKETISIDDGLKQTIEWWKAQNVN